jgi:hypothetical protein
MLGLAGHAKFLAVIAALGERPVLLRINQWSL